MKRISKYLIFSIEKNYVKDLLFVQKIKLKRIGKFQQKYSQRKSFLKTTHHHILYFYSLIEKCGFKEESQIILPAICNRMSKTPYPENCKFKSNLTRNGIREWTIIENWLRQIRIKQFHSIFLRLLFSTVYLTISRTFFYTLMF